jgi:hypothetical protein
MSDKTAQIWPKVPAARIIPAVVLGLFVSTSGCIIYGWTLAFQTHLVGSLVAHAVVGIGSSAALPGILGWVLPACQHGQ